MGIGLLIGLLILYSSATRVHSCSKKFVPDVNSMIETYPHWDRRLIKFPELPLPTPNRTVTINYARKYQTNIESECTCGKHNSKLRLMERVYGGGDAEAHEYPWQAALVVKNTRVSVCGGALINNLFVLTAAHCVYLGSGGEVHYAVRSYSDLQILFHAHQLNKPSDVEDTFTYGKRKTPAEIEALDAADGVIRRNVAEYIVHDGWVRVHQINQSRVLDDDIALIRLEKPVDLTSGDGPWTSCLVDSDKFEEYLLEKVLLIGWGKTDVVKEKSYGQTLQKLMTGIRNMDHCRRKWQLSDHFICVGTGTRYMDAGQGDSGGGLFYKPKNSNSNQYIQIGLASYQNSIAATDLPYRDAYSAYTRIAEYLPWIYTQIAKEEKKGTDIRWCKRE